MKKPRGLRRGGDYCVGTRGVGGFARLRAVCWGWGRLDGIAEILYRFSCAKVKKRKKCSILN